MTGVRNLNLHNITGALKIRLSPHQDRPMRHAPRLIFKILASLLLLLRSGPAHLKTKRTRARHRRELSDMSSQELNDLGIGRGEIAALAK